MIRQTQGNQKLKKQALILLGCLIGASAYPLFLIPNAIAPGGVTGIGTILNNTIAWPVGLSSIILNLPLFIIGFRSVGKRFIFKTLIATFLFSAFIDLLRFKALTYNPLLASVFGAAILGFGLESILRSNAIRGGTDLLALVVQRIFPYITVGIFLLSIDFTVILLAGISMGAQQAMFSMICVFVYTKMLDIVLAALDTDKACYVIRKPGNQIGACLLNEASRGVTLLKPGVHTQEISLRCSCVSSAV